MAIDKDQAGQEFARWSNSADRSILSGGCRSGRRIVL